MGCAGCGSGSILRGSLTARKNRSLKKVKRVGGYKGSGIIRSQKRLLRESGKLKEVEEAMKEASDVPE